ncbi:MAG: hypothetical protein E7360_01230 [Clostridiales bacterium]|nr:hypothetical protein [Clostridiales bacterium]
MIAYLRENRKGEKTPFITTLEYGRVGNNLRFKFCAHDSKLFSAYSEDNEPIYNGDVVEVFLCVGKDINEYYELEVAPNGAVFFAKIKNENGNLKLEFLPKAFTADVTLTDNGYDVEIIVPYSAIKAGDHPIRFNAFRIETEGGHRDKHLLALNPTLCGNFHCPDKFITFDED